MGYDDASTYTLVSILESSSTHGCMVAWLHDCMSAWEHGNMGDDDNDEDGRVRGKDRRPW